MFNEKIRNIKSEQNIMQTLLIVGIVVLVSLTAGFGQQILTVSAYDTQDDTTDYSYYKVITINNSEVDATLTNFPVLVATTSDDFKTTGNGGHISFDNASDISFFSSDNNTQYNHEIEYYSGTTGKIAVFVNVTSVAHDALTKIHMFYGDSDKATGHNYNPEDVWDSNYLMVLHMAGETATDIDDSTSNNNDVSEDFGTISYNQNGRYGYAVNMSGGGGGFNVSDPVISNQPVTVSGLVRFGGGSNAQYYIWSNGGESTTSTGFSMSVLGQESPQCWNRIIKNGTSGKRVASSFPTVSASTEEYQFIAESWEGGDGDPGTIFVDGNVHHDSSEAKASGAGLDFSCGTAASVFLSLWVGEVEEIRISNIVRSEAWLNATYINLNATADFLYFGTEHGSEGETSSAFEIKGESSPYGITWAGTAGTVVWCNATGDNYETIEINMSINATDNVSQIRVWVGDLNDTSAYINASNISMTVSSDNVTWAGGDSSVNHTAFTDLGSNISINKTQWSDANGMYGTNPFLGAGLTDVNTSIFCRFRLVIPSGLETDDFASESKTAWKIYLGYYT